MLQLDDVLSLDTTDTPDTAGTRDTPGTADTPGTPGWVARARTEAVARYGVRADPGTVADCFDAAVRTLSGARVTEFLPLLVERRLREVLGRPLPPATPAQRTGG